MGIIGWLILGALSGWIGSKIMKTDAEMGAIANIVVGIIGAFIGGFIGTSLGMGDVNSISIYGVLMSVLGACILLAIVGAIKKRK
ncbi:MAG: GlsB/YeaQ/YmgE family stress response membrane protein [Peptoniphilaceae bacterium]